MSDLYLSQLLQKYAANPAPLYGLYTYFAEHMWHWAGEHLNDLVVSGSHARGTATSLSSDFDFLVSIKPKADFTLEQIFRSLMQYSSEQNWHPRKQSVSVGISINGANVDLVPARVRDGTRFKHSLYNTKTKTPRLTDVHLHNRLVRESNRTLEIRLAKIWRDLHGLKIPSILIEVFAINTLKGRRVDNLGKNFWFLLEAFASEFSTSRIVDPANSNNILSADITVAAKAVIAATAQNSVSKQYWKEIVS